MSIESPDGPKIDQAAAQRVHFVDPRVRDLAYARYHLDTGQTYTAWLVLGKDNPDALIREARDWLRAAVALGLLPLDPDADDSPEAVQ